MKNVPWLMVFAALYPAGSSLAQAEIYKCVQNGKTVYSDAPCDKAQIERAKAEAARDEADAARREIEAEYLRLKKEAEMRQSAADERAEQARTKTGPTQGRTYRPEELRAMVARGEFPDQGRPESKKQSMDYATCVIAAGSVAAAVGEAYPATVIVNTALVYMIKLWANDAAVVVTCSAPDRSMVTTVSKYR